MHKSKSIDWSLIPTNNSEYSNFATLSNIIKGLALISSSVFRNERSKEQLTTIPVHHDSVCAEHHLWIIILQFMSLNAIMDFPILHHDFFSRHIDKLISIALMIIMLSIVIKYGEYKINLWNWNSYF